MKGGKVKKGVGFGLLFCFVFMGKIEVIVGVVWGVGVDGFFGIFLVGDL